MASPPPTIIQPSPSSAFRPVVPKSILQPPPAIDTFYMNAIQSLVVSIQDDQLSDSGSSEGKLFVILLRKRATVILNYKLQSF